MPPFRARWRWLPAVAWMAFISYWSHQSRLPIDGIEEIKELLHVLSHLMGFTVLSLLFVWALGLVRGIFLLAAALTSGFGLLDEWHQSFVPGREAGVFDWLTDSVGGLAGAMLAWWVSRERWWTLAGALRSVFTLLHRRTQVEGTPPRAAT